MASINGAKSPDEDDDSSVEDTAHSRDGRSVSNTLHDRARTIPSAEGKSSRQPHRNSKHSHRNSIATPQSLLNGNSGSPPSARETFLSYFFGQNGDGPIPGSSFEAPSPGGHGPIGRDVSNAPPELSTGLMAGKRSMDGNNAAFDMKSLGKHIEAVRISTVKLASSAFDGHL